VERCPACSQISIPRWRRFFSRTERFKCPRCSTWLRYQKAKRPPPLFLQRIRNPLLRAVAVILFFQLFMVAFAIATAYAKCFLAHFPDRWLLSGVGFVLVAGIFLSECSILRSLRLVVAERQLPKPQWDFVRDLRAEIAVGDGWKHVGGLIICLALFFGGLAALRPIAIAISRILPMPCACLNPSRPTPVAFPRCSV
jgi:hypothetical protein